MSKYKAEFTAYYPSDSCGGFVDAMGNKLNPDNKTCAAPKIIPFNTQIKVSGTNTKYDNQVYKVTDRGSAIVVDSKGVYHIDLLMHTYDECIQFGRRQGYIEIQDESSKPNTAKKISSTLKAFGNIKNKKK